MGGLNRLNDKTHVQDVVWGHGLDCSDSGQGRVEGCCEYGNESSGSIKCVKFLE
jgi:hypothetical protein